MRGVRFELDVSESGPVSIDLRSYFFDAYLVLLDADGGVLAEDDDGLLGTHARIVRHLDAGRYAVLACALHSGGGEFSLAIAGGEPEPLEGPARAEAEIEDARRAVTAREAAFGPDAAETGDALDRLGYFLWMHGRYAEAERQYLRALEIRRSVRGEDDIETAATMHNLGLLYFVVGRYAEATRLYQRTLEITEARLGGDHPYVATTREKLALVYRMQGRFAEAEPLLERAVRDKTESLGEGHPSTATALNNLAMLRKDQGRFAEAERLFIRALEVTRAGLGEEHIDTATSLNNLASLYQEQGRFAEAEPLLLRALDITRAAAGEMHPDTAATLNALGILYDLQGRAGEAEAAHLEALAVRQAAVGEGHPDTATSLGNLASLYQSQGRLAEAEPLLERALRIRQAAFGESHPHTAKNLNDLALLRQRQGRFEEAETLFRRALAVRRSVLGEHHPDTATAWNNLGVHLFRSPGGVAEAEEPMERALSIRRRTLGADHPDTAGSLENLALLRVSQHRYADALALGLDALDSRQSWILGQLAVATRERWFTIAAAPAHSIDAVFSAWRARPDESLSTDEIYRRVSAWKGIAFRRAARISRSLARKAREDPEVDVLRARLMELDGRLSALAYAERIPDLNAHAAQIDALRDERVETQRKLLARLGIQPDREQTDGSELSALLPRGAAIVDFLSYRPWIPPVSRADEQARPGRFGAARVLAFVTEAGRGGSTIVELGDAAALRETIEDWFEAMERGRHGLAPLRRRDDPGDRVRSVVLDPILAVLSPGVKLLFVIPDDALEAVPLGAIETSPRHCLLESIEVVYATDAVTLRDLLRSPAPGSPSRGERRALLVGGVDYDQSSDVRPAEAEASSLAEVAMVDRGTTGFTRKWAALPGTAREVAELARLARRARPRPLLPVVVTGSEATEDAVKSLAPGCAVLHLATHGFFEREGFSSLWKAALERARFDQGAGGPGLLADLSWPQGVSSLRDPSRLPPALEGEDPGLLAGLVLAGANEEPVPGRDDGVLTAAEAANLDLSGCRLAVLSTCGSSLGVGRYGEGLQSLRRAFHEAGARSVVATLWRVDDTAARELVRVFYDGLLSDGLGASEALRRARLELARRGRPTYDWAAFTLSGDWR